MTYALTVQDMSSGKIPCILLAIVRRLTPCWMRPETEDLTQQALVRVAGAYRRDPSRTLNKSYLNQVARSVVLDHVRKHRDRTVTADTDVVDRAAACRTTDPELQAANGQTAAAIQQGMLGASEQGLGLHTQDLQGRAVGACHAALPVAHDHAGCIINALGKRSGIGHIGVEKSKWRRLVQRRNGIWNNS